MTQIILVNSAKGTLQAKWGKQILQLKFLQAQSTDLNIIELVWDELDWKVSAKQPTSAARLWQYLWESWARPSSVNFQFLVERMPRICEVVTAAEDGHLMNEKFKKFFGGVGS